MQPLLHDGTNLGDESSDQPLGKRKKAPGATPQVIQKKSKTQVAVAPRVVPQTPAAEEEDTDDNVVRTDSFLNIS